MIAHTTELVLDISCEISAEMTAKQDDNGTRQIVAYFTDGGKAISYDGVKSAELRVLRPDRAMITDEAAVGENCITAELTEQMLAVAGVGYGDIRLMGDDGAVISAARFRLTVKPSAVSNRQITGSSDFRNYRDELENLRARLGGLILVKITQSDYDSLESPDETTVYYAVDDNGKITQYLGAAKLSSGSGGGITESIALTDSVPDTTFGIAEIEEV